jgi:hypothetical protein
MVEFHTVTSVLRKPADLFYDVRVYDKVSYKSVALLYVLALVFMLAGDYLAGFIFNPHNTQAWWYNPFQRVANWVLFVALFIVANFLISSIREGQGKFMQIVKCVALCLVPLVLLYVPYIILSNILTGQEVFILNTFRGIIFAWCGLLAFLMMSHLHDYEFKETVACALLTVFAMVVLFVTAIVVYTLGKEAVSFFWALIEEAVLRGAS